jgi:hypothetical protein
MQYNMALDVAEKAIANLKADEGSMSWYEVVSNMAALDLAVKEIAARNGVILPKGEQA